MTRKFKILAAALMLTGMVFQGCEKEATEMVTLAENGKMVMVYSIDGEQSIANVTADEWDAMVNWLLTLAEEGKTVSFSRGDRPTTSFAKEKVTYSTTNKDDAIAWGDNMTNQGYSVTIFYSDGVYYCTAIR